jgi:hypothetical protein
MLSNRKISPKELAANGWQKTGSRFEPGNFGRKYTHKDGSVISHCGHPTALWPYVLEDPQGRMVLTGAQVSGRADYGTAWPSVASAVDYVRGRLDGTYLEPREGFYKGWRQ